MILRKPMTINQSWLIVKTTRKDHSNTLKTLYFLWCGTSMTWVDNTMYPYVYNHLILTLSPYTSTAIYKWNCPVQYCHCHRVGSSHHSLELWRLKQVKYFAKGLAYRVNLCGHSYKQCCWNSRKVVQWNKCWCLMTVCNNTESHWIISCNDVGYCYCGRAKLSVQWHDCL